MLGAERSERKLARRGTESEMAGSITPGVNGADRDFGTRTVAR
jgi:hypothetical protein